jgi:hypothetical protein
MDRVEKGGPTEAIRVQENIADTLAENFAAWNVPILRNTEEIERPADQRTLTKRYTEEAKRWIREQKDGPFFLYFAHSMPHIPLFRSEEFKGRSEGGIYGDVIEEMDHSTGEIRRLLEELELDGNTLVVFTSDNGPWLSYGDHGGSSGQLRAGKGTTWEAGRAADRAKDPEAGAAAADPNAGIAGLIDEAGQPEFVNSAYFLKFKFEEGKYAFVGRGRARAEEPAAAGSCQRRRAQRSP